MEIRIALVFIGVLLLVLIPALVAGLLFVSIVWIHRPDLSAMDIIRECVREIKNTI